MNNIKIYVLNDDRECEGFKSEHGLSYYLDINGYKILFDCGQTDNYLINAKNLNLDLSKVDCIVLSHGHYDHGNGLKYYPYLGKKLICHPNCCAFRIRKSTDTYGGIAFTHNELERKFDLLEKDTAYEISRDTYFLGEIERKFPFEAKKFPTKNKDESDDIVKDDSGIVINTEKGIIVITGCGHSGICNIIEQSKKITKNDKIYAVIGGFHLKEIDDDTIQTIKYFKQNKINLIALSHCTSDTVCNEFMNNFENCSVLHSGSILEL